jgi:hypothetical protein
MVRILHLNVCPTPMSCTIITSLDTAAAVGGYYLGYSDKNETAHCHTGRSVQGQISARVLSSCVFWIVDEVPTVSTPVDGRIKATHHPSRCVGSSIEAHKDCKQPANRASRHVSSPTQHLDQGDVEPLHAGRSDRNQPQACLRVATRSCR